MDRNNILWITTFRNHYTFTNPFCSYGEPLVLLKYGVIHIFGKDIYFLGLITPPFLNRWFCWNRLSSPPILDPGIGTKDAPLKLGIKDGINYLILVKNVSAHFPFQIKFATTFNTLLIKLKYIYEKKQCVNRLLYLIWTFYIYSIVRPKFSQKWKHTLHINTKEKFQKCRTWNVEWRPKGALHTCIFRYQPWNINNQEQVFEVKGIKVDVSIHYVYTQQHSKKSHHIELN